MSCETGDTQKKAISRVLVLVGHHERCVASNLSWLSSTIHFFREGESSLHTVFAWAWTIRNLWTCSDEFNHNKSLLHHYFPVQRVLWQRELWPWDWGRRNPPGRLLWLHAGSCSRTRGWGSCRDWWGWCQEKGVFRLHHLLHRHQLIHGNVVCHAWNPKWVYRPV